VAALVKFEAQVIVTLKPVVNDPQGITVRNGLHMLGFTEVSQVRVGKFINLHLEAADEAGARKQVAEMCRRLLANHVIEDVRFQVDRGEGAGKAGAPA